MAASPEGKPHGVVVIVLPDGGGRHDRTSFAGEEEAVAFLDSGATDWSEEEERRPRAALSLRRAAGAVLALAALAVAGYFCLYAGADAAWRFLLAPEEASGGGQGASSFVLPLYAKERNSTAAVRGNAFQDRCVRPEQEFDSVILLNSKLLHLEDRNKVVSWSVGEDRNTSSKMPPASSAVKPLNRPTTSSSNAPSRGPSGMPLVFN